MSVTLYASGTQSATVTTEHFLSSPNVAGEFVSYVDLSNMVAGDVVELRAYKMVLTSGTQRVLYYARFEGVQPTDNLIIQSLPVPNTLTDSNAVRFSLKQTYGTSRDFAWAVLNTQDASGSAPTAAAIADAVWDEAQADHVTAGSFGIVASEIADVLVDTGTDIPASIAGIGTAGGAAINVDATTDNAAGGITGVTSGTTKVGTETGTFANTSNVNGVYHQITHSGNAIDWVYQFLTGGGTSVVSARWTGYISSANDTITFYAWNHVGGAWESIGTQVGQAGTTNVVKDLTLFARHRGTSAAELGKVYLRLACTGMTSPVLYTDQIIVSYAVTSRSVGYANGAVWIDTLNGVAGTESFVNGVADNPVLTLADALTIATANKLTVFDVANGSTITLASATENKEFHGHDWILALGGQSVSSSRFSYASGGVSGTCTGTNPFFYECSMGTVTLPPCALDRCGFADTLTVGSAGAYYFIDCFSQVAGSTAPVVDMGAAVGATSLNIRRWSGGLTINNIAAGDVISIDAVSGGTITLNGADGNVQVRGMVNIVDNRTGSPTLGTANNMDARFDTVDASLASIVADTNELQTDWANGGRLDVILDARASQTSVDDLPTNAELAVSQAAADDATLAAIAALSIPTAAAISDAVWDEATADHVAAGSTGEALSTGGDPWSTAVPGAYAAGTAGYIVGTNVNATVSSRASQTSLDTLDDLVDTEVAAIKAKTDNLPASPAATGDIPTAAAVADAVWDEATAGHVNAGTFGEQLKTDVDAILVDTGTTLDAKIGTPAGASVSADIAAVKVDTDAILVDTGTTLDGKINTIDGVVDAILLDTTAIGAAGAGLTAVPWNAAWDAEVQSEVQDALVANHLDHLLAVAYDPASKPGAADALLNELVEDDGGVARYTANALEQGPGASAPSASVIADAVWDEATAGHTNAGTFGEQLKTDLDAVLVDTDVTIPNLLSSVPDILADTNELQADWANGGRLDTILDARASQISVDDIPTNAELVAAVPTANQNADALLDRANGIETGWTPRKMLRIVFAALAGKASGLHTAPVFRDVNDTKNRITATTTEAGNRTSVTLDGD